METTKYGISRTVDLTPAEAEEKVRGTLKDQGFGILTEIDVQRTLKEKIDADIKPYKILGACNPPFAKRALEAEKEIGIMMPCNVIVYEDDDGSTRVAAMDPTTAMAVVGNPAMAEIGEQAKAKLVAALEAL